MSKDSSPPSAVSGYSRVKGVVDVLAALLLLILCAPLLLLGALLVKLTSRGPVFYSQVRLGKNGRPFTMYKIRSMVDNCENLTGAQWSLPGDARVTLIGQFLRRTHLDELPQLWNVLRGDMSLVGPRPERPEFFPGLEQAFPQYRDRLAVHPGLTGLAQVQLPPDTNLESVGRKLACDFVYIRRLSFWLDARIHICTGLKVLHVPLGLPRRLLRLPNYAEEGYIEPVVLTGNWQASSPAFRSWPAETESVDAGLVPIGE
jgi:lipopolysaccharide/colanic/teichoic acid biosynthesis glycosyltransferase